MDVVGIIIIDDKQILVPLFRSNWLPPREVSGDEFFQAVRGQCSFQCVDLNGVYAQVVLYLLLMWRRGVRLGARCFDALFDLVHVSHGGLHLRA